MIWFVPGVLVVVLAVPVLLAVRRCAAEASALRRSLSSLAELREPISALQADAALLRDLAPVALRRRSVVAGPEQGALLPPR